MYIFHKHIKSQILGLCELGTLFKIIRALEMAFITTGFHMVIDQCAVIIFIASTVLLLLLRLVRDIMHIGKKEGKVIPLHAMEAQGVRGGIAHTHS
jgi:hypothetical protein